MVRSRAVQARLRRASAVLAAVGATAGAAAISPSVGTAERPRQAGDLRADSIALAERARGALLELYALESRLELSRAELATLRGRIARLGREQAQLERRLGVAKRTLAVAERLLATRLLALYQQDEANPLAIVLGADTLDEAMAGIDGLKALASQDAEIAARTRAAQHELTVLVRTLAGRTADLRRAERAVADKTADLEREHAARVEYISRLAAERRLNAARIDGLERAARAAQEQAERLSRQAAAPGRAFPAPAEADGAAPAPPRPSTGTRTLTVVATGYAIAGRTATGIPAGPGVVAVDPAVIPLGTRLTIPGYGEGVAADVGGSVRGARIDVWFPTRAQALAWGQRTVTLKLR